MFPERNSFTRNGWSLIKISDFRSGRGFNCGDPDLNEYFRNDAVIHKKELLTETYYLEEGQKDLPVGLVSLCNDSIRGDTLTDWKASNLDSSKWYPSYPAVKIARLGVHSPFQGKQVGSLMINMIKEMFLTDNRTGCRLLTINAYNRPQVLLFYQKNGFKFLSEKDKDRKTRSMFFDLKRFTLT